MEKTEDVFSNPKKYLVDFEELFIKQIVSALF